jgi:ribosomal protein S18 acetylase RimI-like enzyme
MTVKVTEEKIPINVYRQLRVDAGLSPKTEHAASIGLANTLYSVVTKNGHFEYIGMARVIGDGGCFCQIVDICVLPAYQGQGIAKMMMELIKAYIEEHLPESCYVSLIADGSADKLYQQFGFADTMPQSKGMFLKR